MNICAYFKLFVPIVSFIFMIGFKGDLPQKILQANQIIGQAFKEYGPGIGVCFNGGKDSTVLLDLILKYKKANKLWFPIKSFYLDVPDQFPEITSIINQSEKYWKINHVKLATNNLKVGLMNMVNDYNTKAIFLGIRSGDPEGKNSKFFEQTTNGWPKAMRVMPILHWNYHDIWEYIDSEKIPVCSLYEKGYSSIGSISNSQPNPKLYDAIHKTYKHARELINDSDERIGRIHH